MEESIAAWEDESGSAARSAQIMTGTVNQIGWAEQINVKVNAEFDRVRKVLESAASKQSAKDRVDTEAMIAILEDKRAEVMAHEQAGYFIHDCQELRDQVSQMIVGDSRSDLDRSAENEIPTGPERRNAYPCPCGSGEFEIDESSFGLAAQQAEGSDSIVQDQIGQQFCLYGEFSVVVNQSHCPEFVHEVSDARPRGANHFGQGLMTQYGDTGIRHDTMLP